MKLRVFVSGLLLVQPALAQMPPVCSDCVPLSGKVVDATDGKPLAAAVVHYRGAGGLKQDNVEMNPPTIQGTVTTDADGTFTLPLLPPGPFDLRASAEGYLAGAHWNVNQRMKGTPPDRLTPVPAGICREATGKDSCGNLPSLHDATIELHPDPLRLTTMSDEALKGFALPANGFTSRGYGAAAFSADGRKLAFITRDGYSPPLVGDLVVASFRRCVLWVYSLLDGKLTAVEIDNELQIEAGPDPFITWSGEDFYLSFRRGDAPALGHDIYLVRKGPHPVATPVALKDLPIEVRQAIANEGSGSQASTADGRFTLDSEDDDNGCTTVSFKTMGTVASKVIAKGCRGFEYVFDRSHDRVLYTGADTNAERRQRWPLVSFGEFDLGTDAKRVYWLPETHGERQILASAEQANGGTRVAYAVDGDCNPAGSDYTQPYAPEGELGPTPNQFSVCFVTFPVAK